MIQSKGEYYIEQAIEWFERKHESEIEAAGADVEVVANPYYGGVEVALMDYDGEVLLIADYDVDDGTDNLYLGWGA